MNNEFVLIGRSPSIEHIEDRWGSPIGELSVTVPGWVCRDLWSQLQLYQQAPYGEKHAVESCPQKNTCWQFNAVISRHPTQTEYIRMVAFVGKQRLIQWQLHHRVWHYALLFFTRVHNWWVSIMTRH